MERRRSPYAISAIKDAPLHLEVYLLNVQHELCHNWRWCERLAANEHKNETQMAFVAADYLIHESTFYHHAFPTLVAATVVKIGVEDFCGCKSIQTTNDPPPTPQ